MRAIFIICYIPDLNKPDEAYEVSGGCAFYTTKGAKNEIKRRIDSRRYVIVKRKSILGRGR